MKVDIGNTGYRIATDPHNFILQKSRIAGEDAAEPGKVMWDAVGFYSSLGGAINGCLSWSIKTEDLKGIQEIKNHLDSLGAEILKSLEKHFEGVK